MTVKDEFSVAGANLGRKRLLLELNPKVDFRIGTHSCAFPVFERLLLVNNANDGPAPNNPVELEAGHAHGIMAANYWDSTQAKYWTFSKAELAQLRSDLQTANAAPLPDWRHLSIYFQQNLVKLARRMLIRQQAIATAQVYIRRFYTRTEIRRTNPYLILATAVYLACKMEECPQHIRIMLGEAARQWPELGVTESSKIGECEFALISTLSSRLILHHPYRALSEMQATLSLSNEEVQLAHSIINDSYNTDLPLLCAPHVVAITAVFLAVVLRPANQPTALQAHPPTALTAPPPLTSTPSLSGSAAQSALAGFAGLKQAGPKLAKLVDWLAESKVDINAVVDATQEMVSLYEAWENYNERACKDAITKFMRDGVMSK